MSLNCIHFNYFQVIIVDDGSKDGTTAVGLDYVEKFGCDKVKLDSFGKIVCFVKTFTNPLCQVRVLTLGKNRGKGGAVRMGMLRAR